MVFPNSVSMAASSGSNAIKSTGLVNSHKQMKNEFTKFVIVDGLRFDFGERFAPVQFFKTLNPWFKEVSENELLQEASEEFEKMKKDLHLTFASRSHKFALACDVWRNTQEMHFLRVTAHWIDSDWVTQRRVINFEWVDADELSEPIKECVRSWGINDRVFSLTSDDVTNNADVLEGVKNVVHPILDGKVFHASCVIRILNSCVQDAWDSVKAHVDQIWNGVIIVRNNFKLFCEKYGYEPEPVRLYEERKWDTTRDMLRAFIPYKDAIREFIAKIPSNVVSDEMTDDERDSDSDNEPFEPVVIAEQDWEVASMFCKLLDVFYDGAYDISSNYKPSSHVVLRHLVNIAKLFSELKESVMFNEKFLAMKETFLKHFHKIPEIYSVAAVMDPRIKLPVCECLLEAFYQCTDNVNVNVEEEMKGVSNLLHEMFNLYATQSTKSQCLSPNPAASSDYTWSLRSQKTQKTELTIFLQTPFNFKHGSEELDILAWWKGNEKTYPVLSSMARDLLTIPSSTLAPDCAFVLNKDKKILDEMACELSERESERSEKQVGMYTCLRDWLRAEMRIQGKSVPEYDKVLGPDPEDQEYGSGSED